MSAADDQLVRQFDEALHICRADSSSACVFDESVTLGVFQRHTRLFQKGDLVIVYLWNGQGERWPVYGRSSRGYVVKHYYVQGARMRARFRFSEEHGRSIFDGCEQNFNRSTMALVDLPRDLIPKTGSGDAAVRRWLVETLRAGDAASGVGAGSPGFLLPLRQRQWR